MDGGHISHLGLRVLESPLSPNREKWPRIPTAPESSKISASGVGSGELCVCGCIWFLSSFGRCGARLALGQGFFTMVVIVVIFRTELALSGTTWTRNHLFAFTWKAHYPLVIGRPKSHVIIHKVKVKTVVGRGAFWRTCLPHHRAEASTLPQRAALPTGLLAVL